MLTSTGSHIAQLVDVSVEDHDVKFALWLHQEKLEDIAALCTHLKSVSYTHLTLPTILLV